MAEFVTCNIKGLDELQKALEQKGKEGRLALRIALSAGGGTVKDAMIADCPEEEGVAAKDHLKAHIKTKVTLRRNDYAGSIVIGPTTEKVPDSGTGKEGRVSYTTREGKKVSFWSKNIGELTYSRLGRFLEFGTHGKHGSITPMAWMTKAYEGSKDSALARIVEKLKTGLGL